MDWDLHGQVVEFSSTKVKLWRVRAEVGSPRSRPFMTSSTSFGLWCSCGFSLSNLRVRKFRQSFPMGSVVSVPALQDVIGAVVEQVHMFEVGHMSIAELQIHPPPVPL